MFALMMKRLLPLVVLVTVLLAASATAQAANQAPEIADPPASIDARAGYAKYVSVAASDPDDDALSYAWDFGDGGRSSAEIPSHTWSSPGTYMIHLAVSDGLGGTAHAVSVANVRTQDLPPNQVWPDVMEGATPEPEDYYTYNGTVGVPVEFWGRLHG